VRLSAWAARENEPCRAIACNVRRWATWRSIYVKMYVIVCIRTIEYCAGAKTRPFVRHGELDRTNSPDMAEDGKSAGYPAAVNPNPTSTSGRIKS
jgi:hypothetical protein